MMKFVHAFIAINLLCACLATGQLDNQLAAVDNADISIQHPSKSALANLSDLVAKFANVSLKYDPNKLRGNVKLNMQEKLNPAALWDVYNQVLISQQYATVVTGSL